MDKKSLKDLIAYLKEHDPMLEIFHGDMSAPVGTVPKISVSDITNRSDMAAADKVFFAIKGSVKDGHSYIKDAIEKGCRVIVCETLPKVSAKEGGQDQGIVYIKVTNSARAWALAAHWHFDFPSSDMILVGVTGTNGKTTIATSIFTIWKNIGKTAGLISTIENRIGEQVFPTEHTTPDAYDIAALFAQMKGKKVTHVVMEVSSHALSQERVAGLRFDVGIFTNLTQDHLDFHQTMEKYAAEKKKLFTNYLDKNSLAIINADDQWATFMVENLKCRVTTYGKGPANGAHAAVFDGLYKIDNVELGLTGSRWTLSGQPVTSALVGLFNVYNMTAVALAINASAERDIFQSISLLRSIAAPKGRCEIVHAANPMIVVDYAHTPDGLEKVLETMRAILPAGKKLVAVFGCGGNRDTTKRPKMGAIASRLADTVIVTSDNPRKEDPMAIIKDIKAGIVLDKEKEKHDKYAGSQDQQKAQFIPDRAEAIATAIKQYPDEVILIAGKGHEDYQIIGTEKHHFSDQEEALNALGHLAVRKAIGA